MIIVCPSCTTRLQVDKAPSRPLTVRCPKCNNMVSLSMASPATEQSALAGGSSPSTARPRTEVGNSAPAYRIEPAADDPKSTNATEEAVRMLIELLSKGQKPQDDTGGVGRPWSKRKALLCVPEKFRERIARCLTENGYEVLVAEDTRQAIETMRSNQLQVVLLEPEFDVAEQGAAFVVREINVLRPSHRRRLFFVLLSPTLRSLDAHSAFLNNVNAVVNLIDVDDLPKLLDTALREYNELYREFNTAFNVVSL